MPDPAKLTVGLIAGELRERAERSLRHILSQTAIDRLEVIVVDLNANPRKFAGSDHPRVRYLHRPNFHYYCQAQLELVRETRTSWIAFLEDHCYAEPQWAEEILKAIEDPKVGALNYTFTCATEAGYLGRAILMAEYGYWMAPHPGGSITFSASTNLAYPRERLAAAMTSDGSIFEAEFLIHREILKEGLEIRVAPRATVGHESWSTLSGACRANGANKRVLGSRRAETGGWGIAKRGLWAAAMVLSPGLHLARLAASVRRRPALWGTYLRSLPVLTAIYGYSACSEAAGYLFGAGGSREEFLARELAVERDA